MLRSFTLLIVDTSRLNGCTTSVNYMGTNIHNENARIPTFVLTVKILVYVYETA
ncbi:hypothetical protein M3196_13830 [Fictibacillus nanhaiensis]|uniref:hypothetical protein n=1 Tax=Fictibacillus nanhaiensis TaxID=742169 RepID=UPI00203B2FBE|nr:hypothetical protein [Fictibacillus nanhaiensis]MCM3732729.1 hypothetical protein [Fictibacillus nanhaiensis]